MTPPDDPAVAPEIAQPVAAAASAAIHARREVDRPTRWLYGFGSVAFGVKDNGFSYFLVFFYNQVMGVPAQAIALAAFLALLFDACIDPLIGQTFGQPAQPHGVGAIRSCTPPPRRSRWPTWRCGTRRIGAGRRCSSTLSSPRS